MVNVKSSNLGPGYATWVEKYSSRPSQAAASDVVSVKSEKSEGPELAAEPDQNESPTSDAWRYATDGAQPAAAEDSSSAWNTEDPPEAVKQSQPDKQTEVEEQAEDRSPTDATEQTGADWPAEPKEQAEAERPTEHKEQNLSENKAEAKERTDVERSNEAAHVTFPVGNMSRGDVPVSDKTVKDTATANSSSDSSRSRVSNELLAKQSKTLEHVQSYWEMSDALRRKATEINYDLHNGLGVPSPELRQHWASLFMQVQEVQRRGFEADEAIKYVHNRMEYLSGGFVHLEKEMDIISKRLNQQNGNVTKHDQIVTAILDSQTLLEKELDIVKQDSTVSEKMLDELSRQVQMHANMADQQAISGSNLITQRDGVTQLHYGSADPAARTLENELKEIRASIATHEQRLDQYYRANVTMSTRLATFGRKKDDRQVSSTALIARPGSANAQANEDLFAKKSQIIKEISEKISEGVKLMADLESAATTSRQENNFAAVNDPRGHSHGGAAHFPLSPFVSQHFNLDPASTYAVQGGNPYWQSAYGPGTAYDQGNGRI